MGKGEVYMPTVMTTPEQIDQSDRDPYVCTG